MFAKYWSGVLSNLDWSALGCFESDAYTLAPAIAEGTAATASRGPLLEQAAHPPPFPSLPEFSNTEIETYRCRSGCPSAPLSCSGIGNASTLMSEGVIDSIIFKRTNYYMLICIYEIKEHHIRINIQKSQHYLFIYKPQNHSPTPSPPSPSHLSPFRLPKPKGGILDSNYKHGKDEFLWRWGIGFII